MFKLIVTLVLIACVFAAPKYAYKSMIAHHSNHQPKYDTKIEVSEEEAHSIPTPSHQYLPGPNFKPIVEESNEELSQDHMSSWDSIIVPEHQVAVDHHNIADDHHQLAMEYDHKVQEITADHQVADDNQVQEEEEEEEERYSHNHPKYEFKYAVEDHKTKDIHSQHEMRDGDVVKGEYMLHQPDGKVRLVKYYVDKDSGFKADVTYSEQVAKVLPKEEVVHY